MHVHCHQLLTYLSLFYFCCSFCLSLIGSRNAVIGFGFRASLHSSGVSFRSFSFVLYCPVYLSLSDFVRFIVPKYISSSDVIPFIVPTCISFRSISLVTLFRHVSFRPIPFSPPLRCASFRPIPLVAMFRRLSLSLFVRFRSIQCSDASRLVRFRPYVTGFVLQASVVPPVAPEGVPRSPWRQEPRHECRQPLCPKVLPHPLTSRGGRGGGAAAEIALSLG